MNSPQHPHSYACIEYHPKTKTFRYYGQNFTPEFQLNASFNAETIDVRADAKQISFTFRADVHLPKRFIVSGYGRISLFSDGKRSYTRGDGSFVESSQVALDAGVPATTESVLPMQEVSIQLDRIDDSAVKRAIGRSKVRTNADIVTLLMAYTTAVRTPTHGAPAASRESQLTPRAGEPGAV